MTKYNVITISFNGARLVFTDVLVCIIYEDGVSILKVIADVTPDNLGTIIENGVHFKMEDGKYYLEFIPTSLIQAA